MFIPLFIGFQPSNHTYGDFRMVPASQLPRSCRSQRPWRGVRREWCLRSGSAIEVSDEMTIGEVPPNRNKLWFLDPGLTFFMNYACACVCVV